MVGKRWTSRYNVISPNGALTVVEAKMRIAARERVTVPAGTFDAFRVEAYNTSFGQGGEGVGEIVAWMAPDKCRRPVLRTDLRRPVDARRTFAAERMELASFQQG